ncbi:MAG: hypothetical protein LCH67_07835 [Bacteroidetes bacterium]|nr:hypothetical protein [Bacteroidota bacterium]
MKKLFILPVFLIAFQSCSQSIDINDLKINNSDLKITYWTKSSFGLNSTSTKLLSKDSKEFKNFNDWLIDNSKGWEKSIASYATPNIFITSADFRLLIFKNFVIIGYSDKNNKPMQLIKHTNIKEFEFLNEKNERTHNKQKSQ